MPKLNYFPQEVTILISLNEKDLKASAGEIIYRRGLDMYLRNKVRQLEAVKVQSSSESNTPYNLKISAIVESSSGSKNYTVDILLNSDLYIINADCSCPYSHKYESVFCKHIIAVLIKLAREKDFILPKAGILNNSTASRLVNAIKYALSDSFSPNEIVNLSLKYIAKSRYDSATSIELKVGRDKFYVVKSLKDFLSAVLNNDTVIEYGKGFTFDPCTDRFNDIDTQIINFLLEIYEINKNAEDNYSYSNNRNIFLSGKKAYLTEMQSKKLLRLLENKYFSLSIMDKSYDDIKILNENIPLDFSIDSYKNNMLLKQLSPIPVPLTNDGEYFFYDRTVYKPSKQQVRIYAPIFNSIIENSDHSIFINKEFTNDMGNFIIPAVKKISSSFTIDKKIQDKFLEVPLKIKNYLDKQGNDIIADIEFCYDDIIINPLNEKNANDQGSILIRDIASETCAVSTLSSFGFDKKQGHFILHNEEKIIDFVTKGVPELQKSGEIYYSEAFKNIKIYTSSSFKSNIKFNDNNLLEFDFNIEGIDKKELKNIFSSVKEKKKYYRLKNGGFIPLDSKEITSAANLFEFLDIKDTDLLKDKIILSKFNALYIDESIKQNNLIFIEKNKSFEKLIDTVKKVKEADFKVPEHLENILRNYQKTGFKWFKTLSSCGFGGILADEMGLGKTIQAIAFIESELNEMGENKKPVLIIVPSSLLYNWEEEFEKFSPKINVLIIAGTKDERNAFINDINAYDAVITSYPLIRRDINKYKDLVFSYCFLDEAQQIKNPQSINAKSVKEIKAGGYFALTGTPIENSLTELWSIFDFIMPGYLLTHTKFTKKYEYPIVKDNSKDALQELTMHIKPFILRRFKNEVVKELPPKIEHKLSVEMTEEQKKLYMAYAASVKDDIDNEIRNSGFNKSKLKILSLLTRLRQICCDPSIFIENFTGESGKMLALDDLLEESIGEGHKILLFSQFTSVLKNIEKRLIKKSIEYMYLDGQTPIKNRLTMVNNFNSSSCPIFLISLKAGGTGLNLTGADTVIHFDPWWNPSVEEQAVDRAHRIGQNKSVEVIKLLSRGTIEEKIYDLQEKKKNMINTVLNENNTDMMLSNMTPEELESLFK